MTKTMDELVKNFNKFSEEQNKIREKESLSFDESQFEPFKKNDSFYSGAINYVNNTLIASSRETEDILSEKKFPFGVDREDIVEVAHPETIPMADGPHTSSVVENQNQQRVKILDMINKFPTGNVFHDNRLASAVDNLVSLANKLDENGYLVEADEIDKIAAAITKKKSRFMKEALPLLLVGRIASGIISATSIPFLLGKLSVKEDLERDASQLVSNIEGWRYDEEYASSDALIAELYSDAQELEALAKSIVQSISSKDDDKLKGELVLFSSLLDSVGKSIHMLEKLFSGVTGLDFSRTVSLYEDVLSHFDSLKELGVSGEKEANKNKEVEKIISNDDQIAFHEDPLIPNTVSSTTPSDDRIAGMQRFLKSNIDSSIIVSGIMDDATIATLDEFAETVSVDLGIGNLDGVRLQKEGSNASLRRIYDIYKHPWKYTK